MNELEKYQDIYDSAIEANKLLRTKLSPSVECLSKLRYMNEFGTVVMLG